MTPKQIDAFCSKLPAATRSVQWEGVVVFKVGGKMFCLIAPPDHSVGRICFKCPPEHYEALSRSPGFRPAPYLARAKWVALDDPVAPIPAFPEWDDPAYRHVPCPTYTWDTSAPRMVENFTDFGHFPFVHPGLVPTELSPASQPGLSHPRAC